jgi:hypothetical protein
MRTTAIATATSGASPREQALCFYYLHTGNLESIKAVYELDIYRKRSLKIQVVSQKLLLRKPTVGATCNCRT